MRNGVPRKQLFSAALLVLIAGSTAGAQDGDKAGGDPSSHQAQFVTVEEGVRLEVLDWGGTGRAIVLLAGSGNSAHVFDEFAPKLTTAGHVYGITRRGFGASSQPESGYDDQRLADDILAVIDRLGISSPILIGHSMAGQEMTTVGRQHSNRLAALVYLDGIGDPGEDPGADPAWLELQKQLPAGFGNSPKPIRGNTRTFPGFREAMLQTQGFTFPEWEFRNTYQTNPDGTRGPYKSTDIPPRIGQRQISKNFTGIRVPVLALFEFPRTTNDYPRAGEYVPANEAERAVIGAFIVATKTIIDRWTAKLLTAVPNAKLVDMSGAGHYLFLTRETDVLGHIRDFVAGLRP
jgi:non-heme chloroperoxidase